MKLHADIGDKVHEVFHTRTSLHPEHGMNDFLESITRLCDSRIVSAYRSHMRWDTVYKE